LDRKVLADIAATDTGAFNELVTAAQNALKTKNGKAAKA
jgi:ribosomal protein L20